MLVNIVWRLEVSVKSASTNCGLPNYRINNVRARTTVPGRAEQQHNRARGPVFYWKGSKVIQLQAGGSSSWSSSISNLAQLFSNRQMASRRLLSQLTPAQIETSGYQWRPERCPRRVVQENCGNLQKTRCFHSIVWHAIQNARTNLTRRNHMVFNVNCCCFSVVVIHFVVAFGTASRRSVSVYCV